MGNVKFFMGGMGFFAGLNFIQRCSRPFPAVRQEWGEWAIWAGWVEDARSRGNRDAQWEQGGGDDGAGTGRAAGDGDKRTGAERSTKDTGMADINARPPNEREGRFCRDRIATHTKRAGLKPLHRTSH